MKKIIFYAPLGKGLPPEKIGGAEAGCLKTLHIYRDNGFDVITVEKAAKSGGTFKYLLATAGVYFNLVWKCIVHPRALVHIVGFYGKVLKVEKLLISTAKLLGHKVVYEMRNGGLVDIYKNSDDSYRRCQKKVWRKSDGLLCQGMKFKEFIKDETGIDSFYYPNYIQNSFITPLARRPWDKELNLIFFGRLVPTKNIDVIIEATARIHDKYPQARLHLIGGVSEEYLAELKRLIKAKGLPEDVVIFEGHRPFATIVENLRQSHFFLFPSAEPNEGHSNSLTEAMGCGVVPIVSTAGFNESICGDPSLVVKDINGRAYARRVIEILEHGEWDRKSREVYERICNNYTEAIVGERLVEYIHNV